MALNKFEKDIKEKLDKRTIATSEGAWEKLSKRLDAEEKSNNTKPFWWIGIAASVIGLLIVAFQFFGNNPKVDAPTIVDVPESVESSIDTSVIEEKELLQDETLIVVAPNNSTEANNATKQNSTLNKVLEKSIANSTPQIEEVVSNNKRNENDVVQPKTIELASIESVKAQEVANAIYALSETNKSVSNASIDSLLKAAQRDILVSRMQHEDKAVVNAALLLQEVETELDLSFREKVFKALKDSYGSVKTAIAQRND